MLHVMVCVCDGFGQLPTYSPMAIPDAIPFFFFFDYAIICFISHIINFPALFVVSTTQHWQSN